MDRNMRILAVLTSLLLVTLLWAQPKAAAERPEKRLDRKALPEQDINELSLPKAGPQGLTDDIERRIWALETEQKQLIGGLQDIQKLMKDGKTKEALERIDAFIKQKQGVFAEQLTDLRKRLGDLKRRSRMDEQRIQMANLAGMRMRPFTSKDFDGKQFSLADYKDKVIVLEWMNPQCPFSSYFYKNKIMANLAEKYKDKGVVWLAVNSTNFADPEEMKTFIKEHNVPYPVLDDREGKIGRLYNARTTPHMFIINKEGTIVFNGAIDSAGDKDKTKPVINYVDQALTELLNDKAVSVPYKEPYGCTVKYAP